jgi:hypothetical protein
MNNYNSKGSRYFYMTCQQNIENGNCKNRFRYDLAVKLFLDTMQEFDRLNKKSVLLEPIDVTQYANLDEEILKEIEEVNKSLSMISDGSSGAFKLAKKFVELSKSNKIEDTKTRQKLKKLRDRQSDLEISVENLNKSVGTIKSGIIPSAILNRLSKEEVELNEIKEEIEKLAISKNKSKVQELEFTNLDKTIDFLKTEEGRLNIINFLTSNNIRFSFEYISDTLNSTAYVNNERIGQLSTQNDNKSAPLGIYGFDNLGNVFTQ